MFALRTRSFCLCLHLLIYGAVGQILAGSLPPIAHDVKVGHPSMDEGKPFPCTLYYQQMDERLESSFYMDVDSVICGDDKCKIIRGRMHWDIIGRYVRYVLPEGKKLTKKNIPFDEEDYTFLDRLLGNPSSGLRKIAHKDLITPPSGKEGVHGVTGATAESVLSETIKGAVYTCYTLWHWANGEAVDTIRKITTASLDAATAVQLLTSGDNEAVLFAVKAIKSTGQHDRELVSAVRQLLPGATGDLLASSLRYLQSATNGSPEFYRQAGALFVTRDLRERYTMLDFIESQAKIPQEFFPPIINDLPRMAEYYEVHRVLDLVERHEYNSGDANSKAAQLLNSKNFFVARRAFWFLEKRQISDNEKKAVMAFKQQHSDRLL